MSGKIPLEKGYSLTSLVTVTQMVQNLLAMQQAWIRSLGWENSLEEGMATHSSILARRIPMDRGACQATINGVAKEPVRLLNGVAKSRT